MRFYQLSHKDQQQVLNEASNRIGLDARSIEKDWWVTTVLRLLFGLPYSQSMSFKGGTSLSKCWKLIDRMSEDIDIAIDREYLGFLGNLSKNQISDKLRRAACSFVRETLCKDLEQGLKDYGLADGQFNVSVNITPITTTDPEVIDVIYVSCLQHPFVNEYILPKVKIEVSGRSMSEPVADVSINSLISQTFQNASLAEPAFNVRAVLPERTFLEKVFLLHEEFSKASSDVRVERMSRHMYDINMMIPAIADNAIADETLYRSVVEHRRRFIGLKGFDYDTLYPASLNILPNDDVADKWRSDYDKMRMFMIYGQAPSFDEILTSLTALNAKISTLPYAPK